MDEDLEQFQKGKENAVIKKLSELYGSTAKGVAYSAAPAGESCTLPDSLSVATAAATLAARFGIPVPEAAALAQSIAGGTAEPGAELGLRWTWKHMPALLRGQRNPAAKNVPASINSCSCTIQPTHHRISTIFLWSLAIRRAPAPGSAGEQSAELGGMLHPAAPISCTGAGGNGKRARDVEKSGLCRRWCAVEKTLIGEVL